VREGLITGLQQSRYVNGPSLSEICSAPLPANGGGQTIQAEKRERWMRLCVEAADEQDSNRLLELISDINRLLHEKEMRLKNVRREATRYVIEAEKKAG
jgi:hypothetical protein